MIIFVYNNKRLLGVKKQQFKMKKNVLYLKIQIIK